MKLHAVFLVIIALLAGCRPPETKIGCHDPLGCVHITGKEPILIGVLQALSGKVARLGTEQVRGFELAFDALHGHILDHPIRFQIEDTGCTPEGGANSVLKFIAEPQTVAILGTTCSSAAATASQAMSKAGLTMISGNNSAPNLTSIGGREAPDFQPGYFRTAANEENSGKAAAAFAFHQLNIRKAATINDGDIYTRGLVEGFVKTFEELGGEIVLDATINKGDREMGPVLEAVDAADAELLFFPLFQPEGNQLLAQARKMADFADVRLMSDGALIEQSFLDDVGPLGTGMYFVGPAKPVGPESERLAAAYQVKYKTPPATSYYLSAYDAAIMLFKAIADTAQTDGNGTLHIGRKELRDTLYATRDFKGSTGVLTCDRFGDCAIPRFNILRLDDPEAGVEGLLANVVFSSAP